MSKSQAFEKGLEQFVEGFFARTFRSGLQPVELGRKLIREMDRGKTITNHGVVVANHYLVGLSEQDTERFSHFVDSLEAELVRGLTDECARNSWSVLGPIAVEFETMSNLKIGRYVIESRIIESPNGAAPVHPKPTPQPRPSRSAPPAAPAATGLNPRILTADGQQVPLGSQRISIGRLEDCNLIFDDPNVSRHHAEIRPANGGFEIADLGSTNGTYVNGSRVPTSTLLRDGYFPIP